MSTRGALDTSNLTLLIGHSPRQKVIREINLCHATAQRDRISEYPYALFTSALIRRLSELAVTGQKLVAVCKINWVKYQCKLQWRG